MFAKVDFLFSVCLSVVADCSVCHGWGILHHAGIQRHEMALSHFLLFLLYKSRINCDVDQSLILFLILDAVAETTEELVTEI